MHLECVCQAANHTFGLVYLFSYVNFSYIWALWIWILRIIYHLRYHQHHVEDDDILSLHYWTSTICWSSTIYWCKGRSLWDILVYYGHLNTSLDNNKSTNNWHWSQLIKSRNILIKHLTNGHFPKRHHASRVKNRSKSDSIRPRDCRPR